MHVPSIWVHTLALSIKAFSSCRWPQVNYNFVAGQEGTPSFSAAEAQQQSIFTQVCRSREHWCASCVGCAREMAAVHPPASTLLVHPSVVMWCTFRN